MSRARVRGLSEAGPIVATILVRRRSLFIPSVRGPSVRGRTGEPTPSCRQVTGVANLRIIADLPPYLRDERPLAFAHRGGGLEAPENTMAAFERAVGMGFRYLETDAHLTRDGVVVAIHDPVLDRLTDRCGRIADLDWEEVAEARVHGVEPVPRLENVLRAWEGVHVNIDPKCDEVVGPLADLVRRLGMTDRVCFGSFKGGRTRRLARLLGPTTCRSLGPAGVTRLRLAALGLPVPLLRRGAVCVQVPASIEGRPLVDERFVKQAHRRSLQVHVWTVDDADHMHRLLDVGVDGLMTDRPSVLRRVLESRGSW